MKTFEIDKPSGFSLHAVSEFYAGFTPGSGMAAAATDQLTLAFCADASFEAVAVSLREDGKRLIAELSGSADVDVVHRQLARMLGLEADAEAWLALGARSPVVGRLQREFPGFFTATKASPYDAAVWALISPRMHPDQAARIKLAIAREHGTAVALHGRTYQVFPAPEALLRVTHVDGLSEEKLSRLHGLARAALSGRLEAERLRALGEAEAIAELQTLRGIGPWSASHIYYRGAAPIDGLPIAEPRILHGLAHASGTTIPDTATFERLAEEFRPFRMWVSVLLSRHLAGSGHWHTPELVDERAAAGRALARKMQAQRGARASLQR
ncbi:MAG: 3-methyladenine glycosylase/8-oxoguanine glycosylase-like protein [Myxococcaceae bacterium]|nr:3-methyladenine glycosylase/8-oxoguanine glycosylase-like protein [Myxococcaceae bacterium]